MNQNEKKLFKELCKFKKTEFDEKLLKYATPDVLGQLFFNRMQGVAYGTLKNNGLLGKVNREFRNSLAAAYEQNMEKNDSFNKCVDWVSKVLSRCNCRSAMLKGAFLCAHYPKGYRTSNDIDLLVFPKDVSAVGECLLRAGFKQGNIRNGEFIPATRKEIIESKMTRGETVPYIIEVNLPYMKYLEVDINFSLDYKNGDNDILSEMLNRVCKHKEGKISIPTLDKRDFFIHLCAHLYKEATTLPWIEMHRDMTLYKYCDIYLLLNEMSVREIENIFVRAEELGMSSVCAYTVLQTMNLFDMTNEAVFQMSKEVLRDDPKFIVRVADPKHKKTLYYKTEDATKRFFMKERLDDLWEGL